MGIETDLKLSVRRHFRQSEILDLVKIKFPMYAWLWRSWTDSEVCLVTVLCTGNTHGLNVPRSLVHDVMADLNLEGLEDRGGVGQPKRPKRKSIYLKCRNMVLII